MKVECNPVPDDNTAAAILAAIVEYLETGLTAAEMPARSAWRAAGVLVGQGLPPARGAATPSWSSAERASRAARWSSGIVGL